MFSTCRADAFQEVLIYLEKDCNRRIPRQKFLDLMAAEFDALDLDRDGTLDSGELSHITRKPAMKVAK